MDIDLGPVGSEIGKGIDRAINFYGLAFAFGLVLGFLVLKMFLIKFIKVKNKLVSVLLSVSSILIIAFVVSLVSGQFVVYFIDPSFSFMP